MLVGDIIELTIEKLNSEGEGLGRYDGFVFFVKNSCPEDVLKCRITKLNKRYGFAEIVGIIKPSSPSSSIIVRLVISSRSLVALVKLRYLQPYIIGGQADLICTAFAPFE